LFFSPNIIRIIKSRRKDEMDGARSAHGEMRNAYKMLVEKPEGKRCLRRPRHRWEDNIKTQLKEIGIGLWIGFIWLRIGTSDELL
jgi:hypothetical protein